MAPPAMTVVGTVTTSVNLLYTCALDTTNNFLYHFGDNGTQTVITKINTSGFTQTSTLTLTLAQADKDSHTGIRGIDLSHGYLYYFAPSGVNVRAVGAVNLNTFSFAGLINSGSGGFNQINAGGSLPLVDGTLEYLLTFEQTGSSVNGINRIITFPSGFATNTFLQTNDIDDAIEIDTKNKIAYFVPDGDVHLKKYTYSPSLAFVASVSLPAFGAYCGSIDNTNNFLYIYNATNGTIYKINLSNFTYVSSLSGFSAGVTGISIMDIDVPNGFLYIGSAASNVITRIDLSTFKVESSITIPTGSVAYGIVYNPNGYLYCSNGGSPAKIYSIKVPAAPPVYLPESKGNIGAGLKKPNNIFDFNRLMGGY